MLHHLKLEIEYEKQTKTTNLFNSAGVDFNDGLNSLNDFINYRNKYFIPKKTDTEIQAMIDIAVDNIKKARNKLEQISMPDANASDLIRQLTKVINDTSKQLKEHQNWLKLYFSKGKLGRKSMFYKNIPPKNE